MRMVVGMAVMALAAALAGGSVEAQPRGTLSDGRTIVLPASFSGCQGGWETEADSAPVYNGVCDNASSALAVGMFETDSGLTPEEFIEGVTTELGNSGGTQVLPMQMAGGKATFVCWLDWSSDTNDGLALCVLREPTARLTIMRTGASNADAMQRLQASVKEITIR